MAFQNMDSFSQVIQFFFSFKTYYKNIILNFNKLYFVAG